MFIKTVAKVNLILTTAITAIHARHLIAAEICHIKEELQALAETEKVHSAREYVLVRFAKGDYNNLKGPKTMRCDYKFYKIIERYYD